ncbi:helix-turn-helix domain-containing protein [Micromonospora sp. PLK6-60]|uniref:helix-turn-helix domain-containing protein n=1 Tax=Micromonospora sp. PLK6-60 TaxID=2873383 RepID=UPI001CA6359D|nr:helix-turn-helix domain-containing protein [Micromonospora sp. PLK6-60]MBY8872813.1 helix-turn-helix domain-containing protein [Micromonospora sp. PLK6-60]
MTPPPPLGTLLAQLRTARGWSQQRLAAQLCAAAGVPTLTRHEISRWERHLRLPGEFWLAWLATVLGVPAGLLADAAAHGRHPGPPPGARVGSRPRAALLAVARRWLADPGGGLFAAPTAGQLPAQVGDGTPAGQPPAQLLDRAPGLAELRRWDDLAGGADLAPLGAYRLRGAVRRLSGAGPAGRRRLLPVLAESAQLAGWLAADAGDPAGGLAAYRLGLRAAAAAGDRALAGHVLGSASHLLAGAGDPAGALLLARTGYAGARRAASPGLRALLLHRVALAAALGGRRRAAGAALDAARRVTVAPEPDREPPWLYWLDAAELAAMTGRTLVALDRAGAGVPLLRTARRAARPRAAAVYGAWLARGHLQLGELEAACAVAGAALLDAVRAGSPRAVGELAEVRRRLAGRADDPAVRRHDALAAAARPWLPRRAPMAGRPGPGGRRADPPRPIRRPRDAAGAPATG